MSFQISLLIYWVANIKYVTNKESKKRQILWFGLVQKSFWKYSCLCIVLTGLSRSGYVMDETKICLIWSDLVYRSMMD